MTLALLRDLPLQLGRQRPGGAINAGALMGAGAGAGSSPATQQPRIQQAASGQPASSANVGGAP
jgi:hypothetical protein